MIGFVLWIDIECQSKLAIALETCTLLIALQRLLTVAFAGLRGVTLSFLFDPLTVAGNDDLVLTRPFFFAQLREVARCHVRMTTDTQFPAASLLAGFLALTTAVALLLALVNTALQCTTTDLAAANFTEPTRLIFDNVLAAQARLGRQVRALGAIFLVTVTVVTYLGVPAALRPPTRKAAWRRPSTTRKRRLQHSPTAIATDLVEDGISTSTTRTFVTELLAAMLWIAAFQLATARAGANVLCLKIVSRSLRC